MLNKYHFITHWRVPGTVQEISDVLGEPEDLTRWWPSVYIDVKELEPGDDHGIGKRVRLLTRGWLPYTLTWEFRVIDSREPYGYTLAASGDFNGQGIWTFEQDGTHVSITYDWRVRADKPILRYLSFIFKPIFAANHRWTMAQGEESLRKELARRAATRETSFSLTPTDRPRHDQT